MTRSVVWVLCVAVLAVAGCSTSSGPSAAPSHTASPTIVVREGTATVSGTATTVLTDSTGATLYYRTSDTAAAVCTGSCAAAWPPLILSSGSPQASVALPGELGVRPDPNGNQVVYSGHPLYRYRGDRGSGTAGGNGVGGVWFAARPALAG
jgi:predicted lipoprotein with Yx(FWY)xxD motif